MARRYTKDDVQFHSDYGRDGLPAVNVKVYRSLSDVRFPLEETPEGLTLEWIEANVDEAALDDLFWMTCQNEWEMLEQDAEMVFGKGVTVEQQGRSGGWAAVRGLPEIEDWDAVALAKWRRFERYAKAYAREIPEQMVWSIAANEWEYRKAEEAEEAGLHRDPVPS